MVDFVRVFKCTTCGGKLAYSPGTRDLVCEYCGAANTVVEGAGQVEEIDLPSYLATPGKDEETFAAESAKCAKCGAEQLSDGRLDAHWGRVRVFERGTFRSTDRP